MSFAWSSATLEHLYNLYVQEGRSAAAVARILGPGLSRDAVLSKVQRMGWAREPRVSEPAAADAPRPARARRIKPPFSRRIALPHLREIAAPGVPRPWTERCDDECAFPVGDPARADLQLSCCAPTRARSAYCPAHRALMVLPDSVMTQKDEDAIVEIARRAA